MKEKIQSISLDDIVEPKEGMRSFITEEKLIELSQSIKELGVLQPILVRRKGKRYEIVFGVRRYYAAKKLEMGSIPAIVTEMEEKKRAIATLHENIMREDVNHIDMARYIFYVKDKTKCTNEDIAKLMGYNQTWVAQHFMLLRIPGELQAAVEANHIDYMSALQLARIKDTRRRKHLLGFAVRDGASRIAIDRWVADELGRTIQQPAQSGALSKVTPSEKPGPTTFMCFLCGKKHDANDCITVRVGSECYQTLKKAIKIEGGEK